jgi:pimeloyl-ACP methyl ester carboxylesterase
MFIPFPLPPQISGYGASDRGGITPDAESLARVCLEGLQLAGVTRPNRKAVFLGHSLGGHVVVEMARLSHSSSSPSFSSSSSSSSSSPVLGVALVGSVCLRPHKMLGDDQPFGTGGLFGLYKWMGFNTYRPVSCIILLSNVKRLCFDCEVI